MKNRFKNICLVALILMSAFSNFAYSAQCPTWPAQSTKALGKTDLQNCACDELKILRNEIFARHGRKFKDEKLQKYFESQPWYKYDPDNPLGNKGLNDFEQKNIAMILNFEKEIGCVENKSGGWVKNESLAGIKVSGGLTYQAVIKKFGQSEENGGEAPQNCGDICTLIYTSKGLKFTFIGGTIRTVEVYGNSTGKTAKNIGIGDTKEKVLATYGKPFDQGNHEDYGFFEYSTGEDVCPFQLYFQFKENRVVEILLLLDCS